MMQNFNFRTVDLKKLLAIGVSLIAVLYFLDWRILPSLGAKHSETECQKVLKPNAKLKSEQLLKLVNVRQGDPKSKVRSIVKEPYCKLANTTVRPGVPSEREVYLLDQDAVFEADANTKLVVMYEEDGYVGYRFLVR
jgi:hypothetical protein